MMTEARRISPPDWITRMGIRRVMALVPDGKFVGGAVRDTLLGLPIGDIDLATALKPEAVLAALGSAGIKAVPTGIEHGTVTAIADGEVVEITTLRHDVETDGRHAVVAFTDDWTADAARRDFTMNALYLDYEGRLWDPTGIGIEDCLAGRVRFVGDPAQRLDEDVLRLLRFYRFRALYGRGDPDPAARTACRAAIPQLPRLAGERIRHELFKLVSAADPVPTLAVMIDDGVLPAILPAPFALDHLARLIRLAPEPEVMLRLAALLVDRPADLSRLKLSSKDLVRLAQLQATEPAIDLAAPQKVQRQSLYHLGAVLYRARILLKAAEADPVPDITPLLEQSIRWSPPQLPVSGADIAKLGVPQGKRVGALLSQLETWWLEQDFTPDRAACLAMLRALIDGTEANNAD